MSRGGQRGLHPGGADRGQCQAPPGQAMPQALVWAPLALQPQRAHAQELPAPTPPQYKFSHSHH